MSERTAVYRLYCASGRLLYIGMSRSPMRRFAAHVSERSWWAEVDMATLEWQDSREEARTAEVAAIHAEHPRYNIAETPLHRRVSGMGGHLTPDEIQRWGATGTVCAERRVTRQPTPGWQPCQGDREPGFYDPATFHEPAVFVPDPPRVEVDLRLVGRSKRR